MKYIALAVLILASAGCVSPPRGTAPAPSVSVFVVAHPDDWQLFMNPDAFHAMANAQGKAVFVHVSAGDAGKGTGGEPTPYYLAREEGALRAVRFMANAANATAALGADTRPETVGRAGHRVARHTYANAVAYFMRIHDGNIVTGNDYQEHPLSLQRLRSGASGETKAIDDSTRYVGWNDFVATLQAIVTSELVPGTALNLHIAELDEKRNPGDHPDHRAVAFAMEEVIARFPCARVSRHEEYATRDRAPNVTGVDYMIDAGTWAATASGLSDLHAGSTWEPGHNTWVGRDYQRIQEPRGTCD
ncbi:MAG TPA: PIG-L family deacetylase [Steroidobacteraceae bacterium]|nr:PIG-L family deacetylase [Steroidobacteraceae bacterium]